MERATQERLVGAVILVVAVVAIVPAVLTGPKSPPEPASRETAMKSLEIELAPTPPRDDVLVPEPVAPTQGPAPEAGAVPPAPTGLPPAEAPAASSPPTEVARSAPDATAPGATPPPAPPAPRAAAPAPDPNAAWAVQLGAFSSRGAADKLVADLRRRGYPAFIVEYRAEGKVLHRVRVGPEQDRARADALAARLDKDGFKGNVARHP
ncbi:MAG: SPOR domain-containing protein [Steroidobacteraceae bacterium]|jgi:DedD protein|nr:SPOR domain-containing protein [Steroidobacteraceae bacterium]